MINQCALRAFLQLLDIPRLSDVISSVSAQEILSRESKLGRLKRRPCTAGQSEWCARATAPAVSARASGEYFSMSKPFQPTERERSLSFVE